VECLVNNDDGGLSILWTDTSVMLQVRTRRQKRRSWNGLFVCRDWWRRFQGV